MNLFEKYTSAGLTYADFLNRYASPDQRTRWNATFARTQLSVPQRELLASFTRAMPVLCLAGAWCGDCSGQCPIFERFAEAAPGIAVRYLDRDDHADVQHLLRINGGNRVPVVVFFSEDGYEVARFGERTLSQYRHWVQISSGAACATGLASPSDSLPILITQDWLNEFERVQWILRLSPRLRQLHGD